MEPQERHYNIHTLNILFALASLGLLGALGALFLSDYAREWKDYQKDFRELEITQTRVQYDAVERELDTDEHYQTLLKEIDQAEKEYTADCGSLVEEHQAVQELEARRELTDQEYKFAKAELDAARYRYETALAHAGSGIDANKAEKEFRRWEEKTAALKSDLNQIETLLNEKEETLEQCGENLETLKRKKRKLTGRKHLIEKKLAKIDPAAMPLAGQVADLVRDLPVIDFANPNTRIQQIVLKDLPEQTPFAEVPRVDRCTTCHLGIANPNYADTPQPFRAHPNLELYVGKNSLHPLEEFGCTVCHEGRGRGTDFTTAAHSPSSPAQEKKWKEKYDWHELHDWEHPMYPLAYSESGCFKCHADETTIPGADKLNLGLKLVEKTGCYNCHLIEKYKDWRQSGPDLTRIAGKTTPEWAFRWIEDPQSFRPGTWMPSFFGLSNNSDPESVKRSEQEILAMVHYLFEHSVPFPVAQIPAAGDSPRGEELTAAVGCLACHQMESPSPDAEVTLDTLRREHGPTLTGFGEKTSAEWLFKWLQNPSDYHPRTRMPSLRLTDQEAADIAVYLSRKSPSKSLNPVRESRTLPPVDEKLLSRIIFDFLSKMNTPSEVEKKLAGMDTDAKLDFAGEKLIGHYGCYGCHVIPGFEKIRPVGTELTEEGSKSVERLDFGFLEIEHTRQAWFTKKLKEPRIFDQGKIKPPDEKLKMPHFTLTDPEVEAIVTAVLGFVKERPSPVKMPAQTPERKFLEAGREIVREFNCHACHLIEGEGGGIRETVQEWLVRYQDRAPSDAEALGTSYSPPNLAGEGKKVRPQWLFEFLHEPSLIRPWLRVRMPTYTFAAAHLNALTKYFSVLDNEEFPFAEILETHLTPEEYAAAEKLFSNEYFDCASCHIVGDKMPDGAPDKWAPDFALAKTRLKPEWIIEWLKDPQALLPGTKMPTYFDPQYFEDSGPPDILDGDENEQIRVLRNYLLTLSEPKKSPTIPKQETPKQSDPWEQKPPNSESESSAPQKLQEDLSRMFSDLLGRISAIRKNLTGEESPLDDSLVREP